MAQEILPQQNHDIIATDGVDDLPLNERNSTRGMKDSLNRLRELLLCPLCNKVCFVTNIINSMESIVDVQTFDFILTLFPFILNVNNAAGVYRSNDLSFMFTFFLCCLH